MTYGARDRAPFHEFFWPTWPETVERWQREGGYEPGKTDFGCDHWVFESEWFFPNPPFERRVVEEDATYVTYVDPQGIVLREHKLNPLSSMPQFIRFPVETREDFRKFWKERMRPDLCARIGPDWRAQLRRHRQRDYVFIVLADRWGGFFGSLRNLLGVEKLCMLFYDDPALVEEMMEADADFLIAMLGQMLEETDIDVFGFWEDMAYKAGPLIGPGHGAEIHGCRGTEGDRLRAQPGRPLFRARQRRRCEPADSPVAGCGHRYPLSVGSAGGHGCDRGAQAVRAGPEAVGRRGQAGADEGQSRYRSPRSRATSG